MVVSTKYNLVYLTNMAIYLLCQMMYSTLRRCYYTNWPSNRSYSSLSTSVHKDNLRRWIRKTVLTVSGYMEHWYLWDLLGAELRVLRSQFLADEAGKFNLWKGLWSFFLQKLMLIISPLCWPPVTVLSVPPDYSAKRLRCFSRCLKLGEILHWINLS